MSVEYDSINRVTEVILPAQDDTGAQLKLMTAHADDTAEESALESQEDLIDNRELPETKHADVGPTS